MNMALISPTKAKQKVLLVVLVLFLITQTVFLLFHKKDGISLYKQSSKNSFGNRNQDEQHSVREQKSNPFKSVIQSESEGNFRSKDGLNLADKEFLQSRPIENRPKSVSLTTFYYQTVKNNVIHIVDIQKSSLNIFFIESKCGTIKSALIYNQSSSFLLNARQCCSVESAATLNPSREVYILHTCTLSEDFLLRVPKYVQTLLALPNVHVVPLDTASLLKGSPVEELFWSGLLEDSLYPVVHASDIIRLVVLWRFGGTYCDLDIMSLRSLDSLVPFNFCGMENHKAIGNSILNFATHGYGHQLLTTMLQHVNDHFNGSIWAANGPDLVTNIILQECNANIQTVTNCTLFTVYNQSVLYPLLWKDHQKVFNSLMGEDLVRSVKETGYTIHFWNTYTKDYVVQVGSVQPYGLLADEFCPGVYRNCGDIF